jgi:hypothetical protein
MPARRGGRPEHILFQRCVPRAGSRTGVRTGLPRERRWVRCECWRGGVRAGCDADVCDDGDDGYADDGNCGPGGAGDIEWAAADQGPFWEHDAGEGVGEWGGGKGGGFGFGFGGGCGWGGISGDGVEGGGIGVGCGSLESEYREGSFRRMVRLEILDCRGFGGLFVGALSFLCFLYISCTCTL